VATSLVDPRLTTASVIDQQQRLYHGKLARYTGPLERTVYSQIVSEIGRHVVVTVATQFLCLFRTRVDAVET
jgi:hypothetical protein